MSDYAPRNLAELRNAISHGGPVSAGRFPQLKGTTVYVLTDPRGFDEMIGPMANRVRASAVEYRYQYETRGSRARPADTVAYVVSAWMSSRHGTGWHPFAAVVCNGDGTWSAETWGDARSRIGGITRGAYEAAADGVEAFARSLTMTGNEF